MQILDQYCADLQTKTTQLNSLDKSSSSLQRSLLLDDVDDVDTTAVPIWSEQPHYKHHSIRLKVRGEGNLSLAVKRGKNECVSMMIGDPKMVRKCRSSKR